MDRQATLLLALGLLIASALVVSVSGWILLVRDRRAGRTGSVEHGAVDDSHADGQ